MCLFYQELDIYKRRIELISRRVHIPRVVQHVLWDQCIRVATRTFVEGYVCTDTIQSNLKCLILTDFQMDYEDYNCIHLVVVCIIGVKCKQLKNFKSLTKSDYFSRKMIVINIKGVKTYEYYWFYSFEGILCNNGLYKQRCS